MLGWTHLSASLYDDLVSSPGIVLYIMTMEILTLGLPETNFVVPVITVHSDGGSSVISSLSDDCAVFFFTPWGKFNETCSKRVFKIPDVGGHTLYLSLN